MEEYVEQSRIIMIFVSKDYFKSKNCLREVRHARKMAKKLVLVHDPVRGGASIDYIKEEECPDDLQIIFHKRAIITWHRIKEFQQISLKLLAEQMVIGCMAGQSRKYVDAPPESKTHIFARKLARTLSFKSPIKRTSRTKSVTSQSDTEKVEVYIPGEITGRKLTFLKPVVVYHSKNNPGAALAACKIQSTHTQLKLTGLAPRPVRDAVGVQAAHDPLSSDSDDWDDDHSGDEDGLQTPGSCGPSPPPSPPTCSPAASRRDSESSQGSRESRRSRRESRASARAARRAARASLEPEPTIMLLYLNDETYVGKEGERLVEELRAARKHHYPILMLHENDPACGGCEFGIFFDGRTPTDLLQGGIYSALALAMYPGPFLPASIALAAMALGAKEENSALVTLARTLCCTIPVHAGLQQAFNDIVQPSRSPPSPASPASLLRWSRRSSGNRPSIVGAAGQTPVAPSKAVSTPCVDVMTASSVDSQDNVERGSVLLGEDIANPEPDVQSSGTSAGGIDTDPGSVEHPAEYSVDVIDAADDGGGVGSPLEALPSPLPAPPRGSVSAAVSQASIQIELAAAELEQLRQDAQNDAAYIRAQAMREAERIRAQAATVVGIDVTRRRPARRLPTAFRLSTAFSPRARSEASDASSQCSTIGRAVQPGDRRAQLADHHVLAASSQAPLSHDAAAERRAAERYLRSTSNLVRRMTGDPVEATAARINLPLAVPRTTPGAGPSAASPQPLVKRSSAANMQLQLEHQSMPPQEREQEENTGVPHRSFGRDAVQVTLLRDSKSRFGFAIGAEGDKGVVVSAIKPIDVLDERDKLAVGDIVLSVGDMSLVNERGLPIAGLDPEYVRSLVRDTQGDSIVLTVQSRLLAEITPPPHGAPVPPASQVQRRGRSATLGQAPSSLGIRRVPSLPRREQARRT
jgi:hypothetical protein